MRHLGMLSAAEEGTRRSVKRRQPRSSRVDGDGGDDINDSSDAVACRRTKLSRVDHSTLPQLLCTEMVDRRSRSSVHSLKVPRPERRKQRVSRVGCEDGQLGVSLKRASECFLATRASITR